MITRGIVFEGENSIDVEPGAATLIDQSRYRSHGTITGATYTQLPSGLWVLDFDPTIPSYVEIPAADTQLDFTSEDFSITARIYINDLSAGRTIFQRGLAGTDGYYFRVYPDGKILFQTNQAAATQYSNSANGSIVTGTGYTVGMSRSGADVSVYRDGADITTVFGTHIDPLSSSRTAKIGIYDDLTTIPFDGKIGFLRVYNYALTAGQHLAEHEKTKHWFGIF